MLQAAAPPPKTPPVTAHAVTSHTTPTLDNYVTGPSCPLSRLLKQQHLSVSILLRMHSGWLTQLIKAMGVTQQCPLPPHNTNTERAAALVLLCEGPQAALHCSRGPLLGLPAQDHRAGLSNTAVMQRHALGGIQQARGKHQLQDPTCTHKSGAQARHAHGCAHQTPHTLHAPQDRGPSHNTHGRPATFVSIQYSESIRLQP